MNSKFLVLNLENRIVYFTSFWLKKLYFYKSTWLLLGWNKMVRKVGTLWSKHDKWKIYVFTDDQLEIVLNEQYYRLKHFEHLKSFSSRFGMWCIFRLKWCLVFILMKLSTSNPESTKWAISWLIHWMSNRLVYSVKTAFIASGDVWLRMNIEMFHHNSQLMDEVLI